MKFLTYLVPAIAVIAPALALDDCAESCVSKAVSATKCDSSNVDCVCDSYVFLEEVFECSTECGSDEDAAIDTAEGYCGALYKRSDESTIEARRPGYRSGAHRLELRQAMTAIHKIRAELKHTSGRSERMSFFRKLRRARGHLNHIWKDGKKHEGWGRKLKNPPKPAHPGKPSHTTTPPAPSPTVYG